ncbi:MAG TPA: TMEM175 family protein [Ktedonobacterales bacterium]|nr:TMEM175 family protein [Ktedonobacterales bacterium]
MAHEPPAARPPGEMSSTRLEAFSDGVLAVIITIMVLELRPPSGDDLAALRSLESGLLIYVLSFAFIGVYWNNHHHLLRATRRISGGVMWANLHLLFWLSLVPVVTAWIGAHGRSRWPAATYGAIGFMSGIAFFILTLSIRAVNRDTHINELLGRDAKALASLGLYTLGVALAFIEPLLAYGAYAAVSIMWFIPDRRLAKSADERS